MQLNAMISPCINRINGAIDYIFNDFRFLSIPKQYQHRGNFNVFDWTNGVYLLDAEIVIFANKRVIP